MYQDTRKQLKTVDISCYSKELATFQEKLKFRELAASTVYFCTKQQTWMFFWARNSFILPGIHTFS